jgi:hypothetical protein
MPLGSAGPSSDSTFFVDGWVIITIQIQINEHLQRNKVMSEDSVKMYIKEPADVPLAATRLLSQERTK